jgi:hypothetical protein
VLFKYPISDAQYARFQHANNDRQIQALASKAGVVVTDEKVVGGVETMYFKGRCNGTMALVPCHEDGSQMAANVHRAVIVFGLTPNHWECWIQVRSKPWWLPWFVLDWGFREALK